MEAKDMKRLIALAILLLCCNCALSKERIWQAGKLLDPNSQTQIAETAISNEKAQNSSNQTYQIESAQYIYICNKPLPNGRSKSIDLVVNVPFMFAVRGKTIYILDSKGKEHKIDIIKTIKK
jgi:hypothetical protein